MVKKKTDSHSAKVVRMVRLTRFSIKNFKSLLDIDFRLSPDSPVIFLIGLNGSGKSTVLQAFDFAGELMRGDIEGWLGKRGWKPSDLVTRVHFSRRKTLIEVELEGNVGRRQFCWQAAFNPSPNFLRCTSERLTISPDPKRSPEQDDGSIEVQVKDGRLFLNREERDVNFEYFGSILSQLSGRILAEYEPLGEVCDAIAGIHSFDLLSPRNIRARSRKSRTIGMSGESLAGYIASLDAQSQTTLTRQLTDFYPWISLSRIKGFQFGWKELQIGERIGRYPKPGTDGYASYSLLRPSQHINDGTLRLLSIMAAALFQNGITLLDEIENGFNPHIIRKLVDLLYTSPSQLIITTHSPEVLQYIPEEHVKNAVKLLFRKEDATTGMTDFFALPEAEQKLRMLSPGEVFLDVDLEALSRKLGKQTEDADGRRRSD